MRRLVGLALVLVACGKPSSAIDMSAAAPDLAVGPDMVRVSDDAAGLCNNVFNGATEITETRSTLTMPMATSGGTIAPGIYFLTAATVYAGSRVQPQPVRVTMVFDGATATVDAVINGRQHQNDNRTLQASGTMLTETWTCPMSFSQVVGYDATAAKLTVYDYRNRIVFEWTRQP